MHILEDYTHDKSPTLGDRVGNLTGRAVVCLFIVIIAYCVFAD